MDWLWNDWVMMAWLVPLGLAVSGIVDVLLVGRRIFRSASEAAAISGMLGVAPLLCAPLFSDAPLFPATSIVILAISAGALYGLHLLYYFKALFAANDAAHAEGFLNLAVVMVPLLSFVAFGETLRGVCYVGIALAGIGVAAMVFSGGRALLAKKAVTGILLMAVVSVSLSLLLEDIVYRHSDYWIGTFWFALGAATVSAFFGWLSGARHALRTVAANRRALLATNLAAVLALAASLRATDLSESVSLVIVIETTTPLAIMMLAAGLLALTRFGPPLTPLVQSALREQLGDAPVKVGSLALIVMGVVLVTVPV